MGLLKFILVKDFYDTLLDNRKIVHETIIDDKDCYKYFSTKDEELRFDLNEKARANIAESLDEEFRSTKKIPEILLDWRKIAFIVLGQTDEKHPYSDNYKVINKNIGAIVKWFYFFSNELLSEKTLKKIDFEYKRDKEIIYTPEELGVLQMYCEQAKEERIIAQEMSEFYRREREQYWVEEKEMLFEYESLKNS